MTAATVVPRALHVAGPAPTGKERCRVCGLVYAAHSGVLCAVCRGPVEYHDDLDELTAEIEGLARMASARQALDLGLTTVEAWCIDHADGDR